MLLSYPTCSSSLVMSHPLILALPELGENSPVNMLIVVVLPASVRVICTYDHDQHVGEYEHEDGDQHVAYRNINKRANY